MSVSIHVADSFVSCVLGVHNCFQCVEVMQVSYFVLYVSLPCLVGLAAEINKSNQINIRAGAHTGSSMFK